MYLLPLDLSLTVVAALSVFVLGILVWLRNKWSRPNVIFALMAFILSLWTAAAWFRSLEDTALNQQMIVWRFLFFLGVAFGPALALHLVEIIGRHPFRARGWFSYIFSLLLFFVLDSSFILPRLMPQSGRYLSLVQQGGAVLGLAYYIFILFVAAIRLYPLTHSVVLERLERRRGTYGLVITVLFLLAGGAQFIESPLSANMVITSLAAGFFILSGMGFVRAQFLQAGLTSLEMFFIVLASGSFVTVLRTRSLFEMLLAAFGGLVVALFGMRAVRAVRDEAERRSELESINQKLKKLDEARSDFVAMVAHQLRGPLGGIRFASDMLANEDYGALNDEGKKVMKLIKSSAERLLSLAESSLNAARFDAGAFQMILSTVDVVAEIRTLLAEVELFAKTKHIDISGRFEGIPSRLQFDREILRTVVFNLVDNAIKYTDHGWVLVEAKMQNRRLSVTVTDTGSGLTDEDKKNLFRRFHRGHISQKHQHDGAGLGLYVVKKLVEAAGGEVQAHSGGLGKGSVFQVEFPISAADR